jgi:hypothetical protein
VLFLCYINEHMSEDDIQSANEGSEAASNTQHPKNETPVTPVNVGEEHPEGHADNPDTHKKKRERKPLSCFEIWTIILGCIAVLVAAGTGLAIYWQDRIASSTLVEIQKQFPELKKSADAATKAADTAENSLASANKSSADTLREMKKQSGAMHEVADAARKSADIASFALQISERAWVGPASGNAVNFVKGGVGSINMIVRNTGHTPALDYVAEGGDGFAARYQRINLGTVPNAPKSGMTTLQPGEGRLLSSKGEGAIPLTEDQIRALKNGDIRYYFIVFIWYRDVFSTKMHSTMFCREVQKDLYTTQPCPEISDYSN